MICIEFISFSIISLWSKFEQIVLLICDFQSKTQNNISHFDKVHLEIEINIKVKIVYKNLFYKHSSFILKITHNFLTTIDVFPKNSWYNTLILLGHKTRL